WRANFTPTATPATRRRRASLRRCKKPTTFYPTRRNGRNMTALAELDRTGEAPDPAARDFNGNGAGRGDFNKSIPEKRRTSFASSLAAAGPAASARPATSRNSWGGALKVGAEAGAPLRLRKSKAKSPSRS